MLGFKMDINGKPVAWRDYSKIVSREATLANVSLPEHFLPRTFGEDMLGFDYSYVNIKSHGCIHNAEDIIKEWTELEAQGVPLSKVTQAMVIAEVLNFLQGFTPVFSPWISLMELVDILKSCQEVKGFKTKLGILKKNLSGIVKSPKTLAFLGTRAVDYE